jgi:2-iminobutanoate/2-iminopropanoate deaminase
MKKVIVDTEETAKPIGPYSKATKIINPKTFIFVSGQAPRTKDGDVLKGDIKVQTKQVFENVKYILEAAGATLGDIVKMTAFLTDMNNYSGYNEIRRQYFEDNFPASSTIAVKQLANESMLVEVEVIAAL